LVYLDAINASSPSSVLTIPDQYGKAYFLFFSWAVVSFSTIIVHAALPKNVDECDIPEDDSVEFGLPLDRMTDQLIELVCNHYCSEDITLKNNQGSPKNCLGAQAIL